MPTLKEQSVEYRSEVEWSIFQDTVMVYRTFDRWLEAANRYTTKLSKANDDMQTVEEVVQLVVTGEKHYTQCMRALTERGKTSLLPFVIQGIENNPVAAELSKKLSVDMQTNGKDDTQIEGAELRLHAKKYAEAHPDKALTIEERKSYLRSVKLAERWSNEGLLRTSDLPSHVYLLGIAEDSFQEDRIRAIFKTARKSLETVVKMEDLRQSQMDQILAMSIPMHEEHEQDKKARKESKEWDHYLGVLLADARAPTLEGRDEGLWRRKMLEIKIVESKVKILQKSLKNFNRLKKQEQKLFHEWWIALEKIRDCNTSRGKALKDLIGE